MLIIWLAPRADEMNQIARCDWLPERVRWSYLARSGLPTVSCEKKFPESHIINPLLTELVRSRWLATSFPGSLILPPHCLSSLALWGGKIRDPGNKVGWLDVGLVLFLRVYGPRLRLGL